jgi:hypothetical protein
MSDDLIPDDTVHAIEATGKAVDASQYTGAPLADLPHSLVGISDWFKHPNIGFQIGTGAESFFCGITRDALLDLAGYHGLRGNEETLFRGLWPVIERLMREKHRSGRGETQRGDMLITSVDLLLYGFDATPGLRAPEAYRGHDLAQLTRLLRTLQGERAQPSST